MTENGKGLIDIGQLVLSFARVNRATRHEDGVTPESDTDHTVMLSISACALAEKLYPDSLDRGLVAQFAIVHDLVEAYAMDTDSFNIEHRVRKEKEAREHEALLRIKHEFEEVYPWLPETIERYEALDTREARFVKVLDKMMPKVTHILNAAAVFKSRGEERGVVESHFEKQRIECSERYAADMPELVELFREIGEAVVKEI